MPGKKTDQHTTIGQNLIDGNRTEITDQEVLEAVAAKKKTTTPRTTRSKANAAATPPKKKTPAKKRAPRKKTTVPEPDEPWDQQPDESAPAFEAFRTYRDMGATRSTAKVARELGKSKALIDRWSSANSWGIRVSAYDKFLDREWVLEKRERQRKAARRNADMAGVAMDMVSKRLMQMAEQMEKLAEAPDPDVPGFDVLDLRRLVESLGKLERLALDESTENVQVTGKDGGPVQVDYTKLTDEERIERMKHLRAEVDKRLEQAGAEV